ncbi:MAG: hypothetical protein COU71_02300 [Parcubacteria group bacterium CG10_big_fil_rev_8_21_14_0_10_38_31]|nr:MAG: hypothetical protein COU71_02300 [Parcubacteria group bacterium CG10_big_fil_rev_8_21_14_0_10_38_31]
MISFLDKNSKGSKDDYQEIDEKRTTILGYILLFLLFVFIIGISQTVFLDLSRIPEKPIPPSYCVRNIVSNYPQSLDYYAVICSGFNDTDLTFGVDREYERVSDDINNFINLNNEIYRINSSINSANGQISSLERQYNLSLQEKIADEEVLFNRKNIQDNIVNRRKAVSDLQQDLSIQNQKKAEVIISMEGKINNLKYAYDEALNYFENRSAWYQFDIFLLKAIFVLPLFIISLILYLRFRRKDSQYTIIFTSIVSAFSVLFLEIMVIFLYHVIPSEWIEIVLGLFKSPYARYVIYYGGVIVVIGIFGGIVYYIQKKIFDPKRVAIRRIKDNKCPVCSYGINADENYCPKCGSTLKEKCIKCGNMRIKYLPHCPSCGVINE